jgi:DivIVA domain-containing protein
MNQEGTVLCAKDILEKEFKIDTRGYRPQEVDKFLDLIIRDYEVFDKTIKNLEYEKKELIDDNIRLKQEIRALKTKLDVISDNNGSDSGNNTTADVLRRISNLEKIIYGKE